MNNLLETIAKNPFAKECVPHFSKEKAEIRALEPKEKLWGGGIRSLTPNRLTTAWLHLEDPLMILGGLSYRQTEVRNKTFEMQVEASMNLRGNRKLTKAKVASALSNVSARMSEEEMKVVAGVLYALKKVQTICFNEDTKRFWTMPEDLRVWSAIDTIWIDERCERMLEWEENPPKFAHWIANRENEGWTVPWASYDGTMEEIKQRMEDLAVPTPTFIGRKAKKEDLAKVLGKAEAIKHLLSL